jgi:hypothetical protein
MTDDLSGLAAQVAEFAAGRCLVTVPAVPEGAGPQVRLGPDVMELAGFLDLAVRLGAGVVYSSKERFEPEPDAPAEPAGLAGQECELTVAFRADGGLTYYWEHAASWYAELLDSAEDEGYLPRRSNDGERERLTAEAVAAMLADPEFRVATPGVRRRIACTHVPRDAGGSAGDWVFLDAFNAAREQVEALAAEAYAEIDGRTGELAAELAESDGWREARMASGRRQATARFLAAHADGWFPPEPVRDEVYARAQELSRGRPRDGDLF